MMIQHEDKNQQMHMKMWIHYIVDAVNHLHVHVLATFYGNPQVGLMFYISSCALLIVLVTWYALYFILLMCNDFTTYFTLWVTCICIM